MKSLIQHISEKLVINKNFKGNKTSANIKKDAKKLADKYPLPKGMWANGSPLNSITKDAAEIFGDEEIEIIVPYSTFHCIGSAETIYHDVNGLMPYSDNPIKASDATTLFYDTRPIKQSNYLPFLAHSDRFYIKEYEIKDGMPVFTLEKYYESFM